MGEYDSTELFEVLREVGNIIDNTSFNDIVWVGDLNWHMEKNSHSRRPDTSRRTYLGGSPGREAKGPDQRCPHLYNTGYVQV